MSLHTGNDDLNVSENHDGAETGSDSGPSAMLVSLHTGNDNFVFHPSFGAGAASLNSIGEPVVFEPAESKNDHVMSAPSTPEMPLELPFDPAHHDANGVATQFHQIVASAGHLH